MVVQCDERLALSTNITAGFNTAASIADSGSVVFLFDRVGQVIDYIEFGAQVPTFAHYLRRAGYQTILSGKMHFCGPDQLHGFEQRLIVDYEWVPSGFDADDVTAGFRVFRRTTLEAIDLGSVESSAR